MTAAKPLQTNGSASGVVSFANLTSRPSWRVFSGRRSSDLTTLTDWTTNWARSFRPPSRNPPGPPPRTRQLTNKRWTAWFKPMKKKLKQRTLRPRHNLRRRHTLRKQQNRSASRLTRPLPRPGTSLEAVRSSPAARNCQHVQNLPKSPQLELRQITSSLLKSSESLNQQPACR